MATEVIWFKRDLRLRDHPPLLQAIDSVALSGQSLLPLFFVEPERLKQPDTSEIHLHWELDCARALDRELQHVCIGDGMTTIHTTLETAPSLREHDLKLTL